MATIMTQKVWIRPTVLRIAPPPLFCDRMMKMKKINFTIFVAAWWLEQAANSTKDKKRNLRKVNSQASEDI